MLTYTISQCRYQSMHLDLRGSSSPPTQSSATKTQSPPLSAGLPVPLLSSTAVATYALPAKISIPIQISMVDLFPPDFWGYVHGFGHHPEGLVVTLTHWDSLKLWQIFLCRTLWGFEYKFGQKKPRSYAPGDNIYLWRFLLVTAGAWPVGRGGYTRTLQDLRNIWGRHEEVRDRWKVSNNLSWPVSPLILSIHNGLALQRKSASSHPQRSQMA